MCIGIFDSGVGGLNLSHQITQLRPNADIIYFGDTAHLPYGEKSKSAIITYAAAISNYLLSHGCTTLVIACNSASAAAKNYLQKNIDKSIHIVDVISPVAAYVAQHHQHQSIGILATQATINSQQYPKEINQHTNTINCIPLPAPLLAAAIENDQQDVIINLLKNYLLESDKRNNKEQVQADPVGSDNFIVKIAEKELHAHEKFLQKYELDEACW